MAGIANSTCLISLFHSLFPCCGLQKKKKKKELYLVKLNELVLKSRVPYCLLLWPPAGRSTQHFTWPSLELIYCCKCGCTAPGLFSRAVCFTSDVYLEFLVMVISLPSITTLSLLIHHKTSTGSYLNYSGTSLIQPPSGTKESGCITQ